MNIISPLAALLLGVIAAAMPMHASAAEATGC